MEELIDYKTNFDLNKNKIKILTTDYFATRGDDMFFKKY